MYITTMDPIYLFLMALHLVGVLFNTRTLASCFQDKTKYLILRKSRPFIIFQCILHLSLLALNTDEVTRAFSSRQAYEWCGTNSILMSSVGFLMIFNLLAILAIEDHAIVCLKREVSPRVAMSGTVIAGFISCGVLLWASYASTPELCVSYLVSSIACTLFMFLLLLLAFSICTQVERDIAKTSTYEESLWFSFLRTNKTAVFYITVIFFCITLAFFEVFGTVVTNIRTQGSYVEFLQSRFFQKIFYLNIIWFAVGIALPIIFRQLIHSGTGDVEKLTDEKHYSVNIVLSV